MLGPDSSRSSFNMQSPPWVAGKACLESIGRTKRKQLINWLHSFIFQLRAFSGTVNAEIANSGKRDIFTVLGCSVDAYHDTDCTSILFESSSPIWDQGTEVLHIRNKH